MPTVINDGVLVTTASNNGVLIETASNNGVAVVNAGNNGVIGNGSNYGVIGNGGTGSGVAGNSTSRYGGEFGGGLAPLRLAPSTTQGSPVSGTLSVGEFYVDNQSALYFCVAGGTPGTWKRVQLV